MPCRLSFCFPSSTAVPIPVGVSTPPRPAPLARMRSAKVPCGTSVTLSSPEFIFWPDTGLVPMWEAVSVAARFWQMSLPTPTSGYAVSLVMRLRFLEPLFTRASMREKALPQPMKPATMSVAPSLISSTAFSAVRIGFMPYSLTRRYAAANFLYYNKIIIL